MKATFASTATWLTLSMKSSRISKRNLKILKLKKKLKQKTQGYLFPSLAPLDLELVVGRVVFLFEMRLDLVDGATHVVAVEANVV